MSVRVVGRIASRLMTFDSLIERTRDRKKCRSFEESVVNRGSKMDARPKIEVIRVNSTERGALRPLDGVQLHAAYSHVRIGTYCPEAEVGPTACENKPPVEQPRKFKKNLGPVSRLLKRRQHSSCLATKSCDNIYSVNKSSNFLDWRLGCSVNWQGLQTRQSSSLDWRVGRTVKFCSNKLEWRDATRSAEQLSKSVPSTPGNVQPSGTTKSKLVSLLKRLSPRLSRPGSKGSLQSFPAACPWIQVEYSTDSVDGAKREDSEESDVSYQQELRLNELRKRMIGASTSHCQGSKNDANINEESTKQTLSHPRIQIQEPETEYDCCTHRTVHEDRGAEGRRSGRTAAVHSEVAGLEETEDSAVVVVPGGGSNGNSSANRTTLRSRPLSLAVQPLNYHRLDPDSYPKHPSMTSQESIGSCSLDVDLSASDRSEATVGSASEKTLHSVNLSCIDESIRIRSLENLPNGSNETIQQQNLDPDEKLNVSNGCHDNFEAEQLTAKKPSYLGLACSISGYSGITRYDSKLREGFRSRDSSPGTRLISKDTSPAGFRSSENLSLPSHSHSLKSQSISPLAMDCQNGFANGEKEEYKVVSFVETKSSMSDCQGYSEVDKGIPLHPTFPDISPIRGYSQSSPIKRSPGMIQMINYNKHNVSFSSSVSESSPKSTVVNVSNASFTEINLTNGSLMEIENQTFNSSSSSEKSFIQQRVERLYGPGALAQGFFKRSFSKLNTSDSSVNKSSNNNDTSVDNVEESLKNLPVLRHLRPEFRAQLPVVSPRKPTDGTEQIIKPLQRLTTSSRKSELKGKTLGTTDQAGGVLDNDSVKLNTSVTSIPDQQLAAPEVVPPVLESITNSSNLAKQTAETDLAVEVKDGHYFLKLLKAEVERLFSLAASAEAELASGDPAVLPEEAAGKLRSAAGKARLLATQKMQQFEGLCQKNINQVPGEEFPTTNEDLAGFWDMVMLQVIQVNELFDQIEKLRKSQWQEVVVDKKAITSIPQNGNAVKRRVAISHKIKPTANSEANRKTREAREQARRQMIEERRRAMRSNVQKSENSVKIFAPET